jgi:hypothetical protein
MMYERNDYMHRLERKIRRAAGSSADPTHRPRNAVESRSSDQHLWEVPSPYSTSVFSNLPRTTRSPGDFSFSNQENDDTSLYSFGEIDENVEIGDTGRYPKDSFFLGEAFEPKPFGEHQVLMVPFVYASNQTGFEKTSDYPIIVGEIIADRYKIEAIIASTRTSTVLECFDIAKGRPVCVKVIDNNKAAFDQGLDEVKVNKSLDFKSEFVAEMLEYFYFKEHLFLVFELLGDNLYVVATQSTHKDLLHRALKTLVKQMLEGLQQVHSAGILHADIKPENFVTTRRLRLTKEQTLGVKLVDFGSSCFKADEPCFYLQSLAYRAPEVIVGGSYDCKIDVWGVGCILAELITGDVLFNGSSPAEVLFRIEGTLQAKPTEGRYMSRYFDCDGRLFDAGDFSGTSVVPLDEQIKDYPTLAFVKKLLAVNPKDRPTASEALELWVQW